MDNFLFGTVEIKRMNLRNLPFKVQLWSYLMVFVPILCIPGYAIYKILITPGRDFDEVGAPDAMLNGTERENTAVLLAPSTRCSTGRANDRTPAIANDSGSSAGQNR